MTVTVKNKTRLTVPEAVQHQAGFKAGDVVEFKAAGGVITILPRLLTADDEYNPEQSRIIDAQLAEGLDDIKPAGRMAPLVARRSCSSRSVATAKKAKTRRTKRADR
jgi:bifunctional DNA-binding transcriptional regulator/antitoxin component of YhaV-PrlF toxin-antitoxin module